MIPNALDVSDLPESAFDTRSPLWWGNTLLIFIESTTVALIIAGYFYLRRNFDQWPPPRGDQVWANFNPVPDLGISTVNVALLVLSCIPMAWTDWQARRMKAGGVRIGLVAMILLGAAALALRFYEFPGLKFRWDDNAYGSLVWVMLGLHLTYILAGALELLVMGIYALIHPLDEKHALDVTLGAVYWYWVAGTGLLLYAIIYWAPRIT